MHPTGRPIRPTLTVNECILIRKQIAKFDAKNAGSLEWLTMSTNLEDALNTIDELRKTLDLAQELIEKLEDRLKPSGAT